MERRRGRMEKSTGGEWREKYRRRIEEKYEEEKWRKEKSMERRRGENWRKVWEEKGRMEKLWGSLKIKEPIK